MEKEVWSKNYQNSRENFNMTLKSLESKGINISHSELNINELDPEAESYPILRNNEDKEINCFLSNSFGFGGTNGSIIIKKI